MSDNKTQQQLSYEQAVEQLEGILNQLESGELPLEQAIKQFESGVKLVKHCQTILDVTEQKINNLSSEHFTTPSMTEAVD